MSAIARLVLIYFTGSAWQRWFSITGLSIIVLAVLSIESVVQSFRLQALCFAATAAFFVGSALMPKIVGQLARSHVIHSQPYGRLKLLLSALLTTILVSIPLPLLSVLTARISFSRIVLNPDGKNVWQLAIELLQLPFFWNVFANVFWFCTFLYVVVWFLTTSRTVIGKVLTLLIAVALLSVPPRFVSMNPDASIRPLVIAIAACWLLFALAILLLPRWRLREGVMKRGHEYLKAFRPAQLTGDNNTLQAILGIANPWILALAIVLCIALDTLFVRDMGPWLFFLAILAIVASSIAAMAAVRSRALWLRKPWSRSELFLQIERLLWKHTALSLAIMVMWFIGIGIYLEVPAITLLAGVPLIVASAACSLYLGLMQTRGLRWLDAVLAIGTTLAIMAAAVLGAPDDFNLPMVATLESLLCVAAFIFRTLARNRWTELDWSLCRPPLRMASKG